MPRRATQALFATARAYAPAILFFDEVDYITRIRTDGETAFDRRIKNQLLNLFNLLNKDGFVLLMGATNRLRDIDSTSISRFQRRLFLGLSSTTKSFKWSSLTWKMRLSIDRRWTSEATDCLEGDSMFWKRSRGGPRIPTFHYAVKTQESFNVCIDEWYRLVDALFIVPSGGKGAGFHNVIDDRSRALLDYLLWSRGCATQSQAV